MPKFDLNEEFAAVFVKEDNGHKSINHTGNAEQGLEQPEIDAILAGMNNSLSGLFDHPSLNPYYSIVRYRERIKTLFGLTFDDVTFLGQTGKLTTPLVPMYNWELARKQSGEIFSNNSWMNLFHHGQLALKINWIQMKGMFTVSADIILLPKSTLTIAEKRYE